MNRFAVILPFALVAAAGCRTQHKVDMTHEIKPIHITIDINVKVDRALDNFFEDIDTLDHESGAQE